MHSTDMKQTFFILNVLFERMPKINSANAITTMLLEQCASHLKYDLARMSLHSLSDS